MANRFSVYDGVLDGGFRNRLKLDNKTGSLIITDIRAEDAGVYELQTNQISTAVILKVSNEMRVWAEKSVTLSSGVTRLRNDDQIQWRFGDKDTLIAEIIQQTNRFSVFDDVLDGRFRDRLKLDKRTGSLTIPDTRTEHAGVYKLQTNNEINTVKLKVRAFKEVSVTMGDSVTLSSGVTEIMDDDQIQWRFGDEDNLIAEVNITTIKFSVHDDVLRGRFRDRLKLDSKTGSLSITDTTVEYKGDYKLQTNYIDFTFRLIVCDDISVKEGDSVTLNSDLTKLKKYDQIEWRFGDEDTLIAEIYKQTNRFSVFDDVLDGRFRDRLKLDNKTGSLTITDTRTEHAGVYKLLFNYKREIQFILTVAPLPVPVLIFNSSQCSSSSSSSVQYCSVLCSVVNVSAVSLSWYKGNSLLSSISVSDLSISLSLPLEVEYQENNTYSCVINNTISNQTQHLDISQLCPTCSDSVHCCGPTEAAIRLVLSALVGVATVIIVLNDIRSRRAQKRVGERLSFVCGHPRVSTHMQETPGTSGRLGMSGY
ncbi:uncharacterized protein LOC130216566 [Danio aesculapii]|uniref:uncharacterized protein LOC130216566 n=1 Tax=Danio aesculapii TaxID=1142201 RepID=UPI0024C06663|nr:uncharacterized protein LOC130216566 [Danio aesculapii]